MEVQIQYRELVDGLVEGIKDFYGDDLCSIVLFGSVARGAALNDSDLVEPVAGKEP